MLYWHKWYIIERISGSLIECKLVDELVKICITLLFFIVCQGGGDFMTYDILILNWATMYSKQGYKKSKIMSKMLNADKSDSSWE